MDTDFLQVDVNTPIHMVAKLRDDEGFETLV